MEAKEGRILKATEYPIAKCNHSNSNTPEFKALKYFNLKTI